MSSGHKSSYGFGVLYPTCSDKPIDHLVAHIILYLHSLPMISRVFLVQSFNPPFFMVNPLCLMVNCHSDGSNMIKTFIFWESVPSFYIFSMPSYAIPTFPASIAARDHVLGVLRLTSHVGSEGAKVVDRAKKLQQDGAVPQFSGKNTWGTGGDMEFIGISLSSIGISWIQ